jgi:hypothetical protein
MSGRSGQVELDRAAARRLLRERTRSGAGGTDAGFRASRTSQDLMLHPAMLPFQGSEKVANPFHPVRTLRRRARVGVAVSEIDGT